MEEEQQQRQEQQRQQFVIDVATNNVPPTRVNYIDGFITIDLLDQIGYIDITRPGLVFDWNDSTSYRTNMDGRIIFLVLHRKFFCWVLPDLISSLTMLQSLELSRCHSLPDNFNLPNLTVLILRRCDEGIFNNMNEASKIELPALQTLELIDFNDPNLRPTPRKSNLNSMIPFIKQLPSLDGLFFTDEKKEGIQPRSCVPILELLMNDECFAFLKKQLKYITICGFNMIKEDLVTFFTDVLPKFPDVVDVALPNNQIETFQDVVPNSIIDPNSCNKRSLIRIDINRNPVMGKLSSSNNDENENKNERKAVIHILSIFSKRFIVFHPINGERFNLNAITE